MNHTRKRLRTIFIIASFYFIPVFTASAQQVTLSHPISADASKEIKSAVALPETVRVLALMVDFQEDSDTRSTGTGKFGTVFKRDYGRNILDPLPFDKAYFENHLKFLNNYVYKVSGGRTSVVSTVLNGIVTLPKIMQSYSPKKDESNKAVADLAVDAWTLAATKFPTVDFTQDDFFIIFHAGVGKDVNLASVQGYNPAPYDIPSLYIGLNAMKKFYGSQYQGIPLRGGSALITNTAIIPSTESREIPSLFGGESLLNLSINGLLAASFGNWAGLPDLFDTKTGNTGIGRFGLMDGQSIFAYGGVCPPEPSAWEKQFVGWAVARNAEPGKKEYFLIAHRTDQLTTSDIIRVPITSGEYWLIENRQRDPKANGQEVTTMVEGQVVKTRFPKDTTGFSSTDLSSVKGIVIDVEDIDWSLPGGTVIVDGSKQVKVNGGLLIWHIDEAVIDAGLSDNTVNADKNYRGVDLEQASGSQDIGETLSSPFGNIIGEGSPLDFWFKGNISPLYKNSFGKQTFPSTRTNAAFDSHVSIDNFSEQSLVMTCDITVGDNIISLMPGFPVKLFDRAFLDFEKLEQHSITTGDLDNDGIDELIVSLAPRAPEVTMMKSQTFGYEHIIGNTDRLDTTFLWFVRQNASGFFQSDPIKPSARAIASTMRLSTQGWLRPRLTITDVNNDGRKDIIFSEDFGPLRVFEPLDRNNDKLADSLFGYDRDITQVVGLRDGIVFSRNDTLMVYKKGILTLQKLGASIRYNSLNETENKIITQTIPDLRFQTIDLSTSAITPFPAFTGDASFASNICIGHINQDLSFDVAVGLVNSLQVFDANKILPGFPVQNSGSLILADVDGDKRNDIVVTTWTGVSVYNYAGALIDHYPVKQAGSFTLAARLGPNEPASLFVVSNGSIAVYDHLGKNIEGFPIATAQVTDAVLFPVGKTNQTLGLAIIGDDGYLYAYDLKIPVNEKTFVWRSRYHDERNTNFLPDDASSEIPISEFFPESRCYNWPNPVYTPTTKIRYYVSKDATIAVKIYDLAGTKVDELQAKAVGETDNEIDWNVSNVQSGIYLAHVEATAGSESGIKIIKIAVVK